RPLSIHSRRHSHSNRSDVDTALGGVTVGDSHPHPPCLDRRRHSCVQIRSFSGITDWLCSAITGIGGQWCNISCWRNRFCWKPFTSYIHHDLIRTARKGQSRWLTIPRSDFRLVLSRCQQELIRQKFDREGVAGTWTVSVLTVGSFASNFIALLFFQIDLELMDSKGSYIASCRLWQGVDGTWTVSVLTIGPFTANF
ncbi:hypothetical protein A2U01_0005343, partial [Trifolium medium]|nr:hypothetical protein [Trifolium medium]